MEREFFMNDGCGFYNSSVLFNPNWENSMDQSDLFESTLSSIVSSPANSHAGTVIGGGGGENVMVRELIGRLGSICNSGEISQLNGTNNNSTNTSCYNTPLNSPPKLNLSPIMESHMRGNSIPQNLAPFSADLGFASFGNMNLSMNGQLGCNETQEFGNGSIMGGAVVESGKLSRVSSYKSSQIGVQEGTQSMARFSRSLTPENAGDSREGSSVSEQITGAGESGFKRKGGVNTRKRKSAHTVEAKDVKVVGEKSESIGKKIKPEEVSKKDDTKTSEDANQKQNNDNSKPAEPPKDYIHVRARRGQATDSHSLAERVRREKISKRMKFLQDLVPGCNKVTGKAVMLDEIINYVQSLQHQVEFLSMKLATVNPRMDFNMETLLPKDIFKGPGSSPQTIYPVDSSVAAFAYEYQSMQMPPLHSGISNGIEKQFSVASASDVLQRNLTGQMPNGYNEAVNGIQNSKFWEDELHTVVQMGYGQNQLHNPNDEMKREL